MRQSHWAGACALVIAFGFSVTLYAQEGESNPFADDAASRDDTVRKHALAERRIEFILDEPLQTPLEFPETPLNTITGLIEDEYDIPIVFDTSALDSIAVSSDVEVSVNLRNITLRSALELMLSEIEDLTYVIDDEILLITTEDEAATRLEVRVYRVDDLVSDEHAEERIVDDDRFSALVEIIVSAVETDSWAENNTGEGEIRQFPPGLLIISQTRRVHDQIRQLLAEISAVKAAIEADSPNDATAEQPVTRGFTVTDSDATASPESRHALRQAILRSVPWDVEGAPVAEDEVFVEVLPSRVLVRHLPSVLRDVERALQQMGVSSRSDVAVRKGGGGGFFSVDDPFDGF